MNTSRIHLAIQCPRAKSKEVFCNGLLRRHASRILRRGLEDSVSPSRSHLPFLLSRLKNTRHAVRIAVPTRSIACIRTVFAELQDCGNIAAAVTIVGSAPHCDDGTVKHFFETFHDQLMGSADEAEIVLVVETFDNVGAEEESSTSRRKAPAVDLVWIGPEKITHSAFMWDLLLAVKQPNLVDTVDKRRKIAVNAQHGTVPISAGALARA